jgi:radical SAM superfamily enzyme YgiQ (UPF0313 family)
MKAKYSKNNEVDVILIYPKTGTDFGATIATPHSVLAVAAPLHKEGYKVKVIDQRTSDNWRLQLTEYLEKRPICVGISSMTGTQIHFALEAAKIIRNHSDGKVPIVWGGPHPSILPEQTLKSRYVDVVCIGEGDLTFIDLVRAYQNKGPLNQVEGIVFKNGSNMVSTPARDLIDIEELLPVPWDLIDVNKYIHRDYYIKGVNRSLDIGQTSRGCPYQCGFCVSASLRQRKWRAMSAEKALETIIEPVKKFKLEAIWIRDDEFYIDRDRAYKICEGIIASGLKIRWYTSGTRINVFNKAADEEIILMKKSGADTLKFGAESGCNRILDLMQKGIRVEETLKANLKAKRCGIIPAYALMIGFPTETFDEINQTIDLFVRLKKDNPQAQFEVISPFLTFPKTPLYDMSIKMGLEPPTALEGWTDWLIDEYDIEGKKMPWLDYSGRKRIGNIAYMSILSNSAHNAIEGISNGLFRFVLKLVFIPISAFERIKLKRKWYSFAPELDIVRFFRSKIFYPGNKSIH